MLKATLNIYSGIIEGGLTAGAKTVVCHCYDYAIPSAGKWLGRPLARLGIVDPALQQQILRILIDRFHDGLVAMAAPFGGRVHIADTRKTVNPGNWYDELHPTNQGYKGPAETIRRTARPSGLEARVIVPPAVDRPLQIADTAAVEALLATSNEHLLEELGRREIVIDLDPLSAASMSLELTHSGVESMGHSLRKLGERIVAQYLRQLYDLLCGDGKDDLADRNALRDALNFSGTALIGTVSAALIGIGCPPFLAPLIAAIVVRRGINPAYQETCRIWAESLTEADEEKQA